MLALARPRLEGLPVDLVHANFDQLAEVLSGRGIPQVDGVFADLGFSSDQLTKAERGLSFREEGPLDMRLDPTTGATAANLVNTMGEAALADVFWEYGEERHSRRVAKRIVERRADKPITTTAELAELVRRCVPRSGNIDPATRVFQALRIAVNDELGALDRLLAILPKLVRAGGKAGIISFHSLEDRRVKQAFRGPETGSRWKKNRSRRASKKPLATPALAAQAAGGRASVEKMIYDRDTVPLWLMLSSPMPAPDPVILNIDLCICLSLYLSVSVFSVPLWLIVSSPAFPKLYTRSRMTEPIAVDVPGKPAFPRSSPPAPALPAPRLESAPKPEVPKPAGSAVPPPLPKTAPPACAGLGA